MLERFMSDDVSILVIEDDDVMRSLVTRMLNQMGASKILDAANGHEGLRIACTEKPTLVICDLEMEPVDGMSFLGGLRNSQDKYNANIPVIMFTGDKNNIKMQKALTLGIDGYLIKPFNPKGFSTYVVNVATKRRGSFDCGKDDIGGI